MPTFVSPSMTVVSSLYGLTWLPWKVVVVVAVLPALCGSLSVPPSLPLSHIF